ncbi:hypothetical protein M0813_23759 [Anaeramoeba flamelloides]|uniref:Uncharacterized protein n=1 Tax=Anaeramoeba flamelloides TaxID=1746091 RepID=A0ABQ8Y8I2_9EUKA|nr:hypothetical protein M0813_23759 [Anaeramoeba flamelloides]
MCFKLKRINLLFCNGDCVHVQCNDWRTPNRYTNVPPDEQNFTDRGPACFSHFLAAFVAAPAIAIGDSRRTYDFIDWFLPFVIVSYVNRKFPTAALSGSKPLYTYTLGSSIILLASIANNSL